MLNPRVGLILEMFSPLIFFRMVVLPALSRPLPQVLRKLEAQENNKLTGTGSAFLSPSGGSSV